MVNLTEHLVQDWRFQAADKRLQFPRHYLPQLQTYIHNWTGVFPPEPTWIKTNYGIPSLFLSVKCALDNRLRVMGIDPAPVGIGIAKKLNPYFSQMLNGLQETWPQIYLLENSSHANDDSAWLETVSETEARKAGAIVLIRAKPQSPQYDEFVGQSVTPAFYRYDRSYGVSLQMWEEVRWSDMKDLNWEGGFCLKGRNSKAIEIWHPQRNRLGRKGIRGISTKTRISAALLRDSMYYQNLIPPMPAPCGLAGKYMVYKLFFLFDMDKGGYVYAGGLWEACSSLNIHGTPETIFGPLD